MRAVDLIARKRDGGTLSPDEIEWLIGGYCRGDIPDYQMAAWAMAVVLRGMELRETTDLALVMARSGSMLDLHAAAPLTADKHSTGGVGDKTSLVLLPLVAAVGLPVAKMSGRGLDFTGGTIDKLESIPGLRTDMSVAEFRQAVREVGLVIATQTADMAPADKRLYALRDVTATVESIPLIAASVMSKKLAAGADCIILDVKYGSGAFAHTLEQARDLARTMVQIGRLAGRRVAAVISSMEQPLGYAIGNALEVREVVAALRGSAPPDLAHLCSTLGAYLLMLAGTAASYDDALQMLDHALSSGAAWERFRQMVRFQGGAVSVLDNLGVPALADGLPAAPVVMPMLAPHDGYIQAMNTRVHGTAVNMLGCGRRRKEDTIDPAVGIVLAAKIGDRVAADTPLLHIHAASEADAAQVMPMLREAYTIGETAVLPPPLVAEVIHE
jgi:pyrimidine-nucleoside phosphorylase